MLFHQRTILPGGFRIAETLVDLTGTGLADSVKVKDFAWVKDEEKFYVCTAVPNATSSGWMAVATGGGGSTPLRIAPNLVTLQGLGSTNGIVVGDLAWLQDVEQFYVAGPVLATSSTWTVAEGIGDVKHDAASITFTGEVSFTQNVTLGGIPTEPDHAITKDYVDSKNFIKADGSVPFTGNQSLDNHKLTLLLTPTDDFDAATKKYVDDHTTGAGLIGAVYKYQQAGSLSTSTTDFSAISVTLITGTIPTGLYRLGVSYHWKDTDKIKIKVMRRVTGTLPATAVTVIGEYTERSEDPFGSELHVSYTFIQETINTSADYTYELKFASTSGGDSITMVNARLELQKVAALPP